jgi:hypothetical protein
MDLGPRLQYRTTGADKENMNFSDIIRTTKEWLPARRIIAGLALILAFGLGYLTATLREPPDGTFHDIIVNDPDDLVKLITPDDKRVRALVLLPDAARFVSIALDCGRTHDMTLFHALASGNA